MSKNYRIPINIGKESEIRVNIEQDFDFLDILSLKLKQEDLYSQFCADYGVIAGRVIANGGFGIPNVNVSIFVPLDSIDEENPIISTLYPYKEPIDKNEDGYRYNLLPYKQEYNGHNPTGTFPDKEDIVRRSEVLKIYEKYYKYTTKTNESGDFMIVGVPLGQQKIVFDCDLSNIGQFSLRPTDLIRMGLGVESQFDGQNFRNSEDLDSLPQIINDVRNVDITPFWGQDDLCNIGITRCDLDLREKGIEIQPTAVFMGSIFSSSDSDFLRRNCKSKSDMGNLCSTQSGPGTILAIRQTIDTDESGRPVLERFNLENNGNIIDENGVWITEIPMNLDYVTTNEFGEQIISSEPKNGIPTNAKYRFRVKWQNESGLQADIMRADYLIPNIKEHGWFDSENFNLNRNSSYAFSLDWDEYADIDSAIKCEDTFYKFNYNKVYTIASHIDRFKWGINRARHMGIKEITDRSCESDINRFPVNDAQRNFDFLAFLMNIVMFLITPIFTTVLSVLHVLALLYPIIRLVINLILKIINTIIYALCKTIRTIMRIIRRRRGRPRCSKETISNLPKENPFKRIKLPMISFPNCETCNCNEPEDLEPDTENETIASLSRRTVQTETVLLNAFETSNYIDFNTECSQYDEGDSENVTYIATGTDIFTFDDSYSEEITFADNLKASLRSPLFIDKSILEDSRFYFTNMATLPQLLNQINHRSTYFNSSPIGVSNRISVKIKNNQIGPSFSDTFTDQPLILIVEDGSFDNVNLGSILTFNNDDLEDPNINTDTLNNLGTSNQTFQADFEEFDYINKNVEYIDENGNNQLANVRLYNPNPELEYTFTAGMEYFQVIHIQDNIGEFVSGSPTPTNPIDYLFKFNHMYGCDGARLETNFISKIDGLENKKVIILNRGVDMYSPKQRIEYDFSELYGQPLGTILQLGDFRLNFPIKESTTDIFKPLEHFNRIGFFEFNDNQNDTQLFNKPYLLNSFNTLTPFNTNKFSYYSCVDSSTANDFISSFNGETTPFFIGQDRVDGNSFHFAITPPGSIITVSGGPLQIVELLNNRFIYTMSGIYDNLPTTTINTENLVFRSDRLPTSDVVTPLFDSLELQDPLQYPDFDKKTKYPLFLNNSFTIYDAINGTLFQPSLNFNNTSIDDSGNEGDFIEDYDGTKLNGVLESSSCENMVPLGCYEGKGDSFGIKENCDLGLIVSESADRIVENGCYSFVRPPYILSLVNDYKFFLEWRSRFRFNFSACRGVIGKMFQNNWVNGTLYMPSFQKLTFFNNNNEVSSYRYCGSPQQANTQFNGPIYYNTDTNSFYYRSTPFGDNQFYGQKPSRTYVGANEKNIWFPTTITELGPRDEFIKEIVFSPKFEGYIVDKLQTTSYKDTSDIVNLFILSRLVNSSFLEQLTSLGGGSIASLFSRGGITNFFDGRIDGDVAQLFSINSEFGVTPYINGNYDDNDITVNKDRIGIWFDSNLVNRRIITPGIKTFGDIDNNLTFKFGHPNTQNVPYYLWKVNENDLFGTEKNNWETNIIASSKYQDDNFDFSNYLKPNFGNGLGYIYNRSTTNSRLDEAPSQVSIFGNSYKVGGPNHFYFGLNKGKSAMNKFINRYIFLNE